MAQAHPIARLGGWEGYEVSAQWTELRAGLCSAITRSRQNGRRQIFVMQAAQHRSDAHREALADPMAG